MSVLFGAWLTGLILLGGVGPPAPTQSDVVTPAHVLQCWGMELPNVGGQGGRSYIHLALPRSWAAHDGSPTAATPEQLAALREVLARPEFGAAAGRSVLDRVLDPVRSLLRWVLGELSRLVERLLAGNGEAISYATLAVGLAITAAAGLVVRRLLRGTLATEAERLLDERRQVLATLEGRGVITLDLPADRLSPQVVATYLELKARGRL